MISMNFIRRNMKPLMAAMTLMAMITFVFDDAMRAGSSYLIPAIFGMLAGGAAFVWGTRSGKQNEYLAMGAVVGVVFGLVVITFAARERGETAMVAGLTPQQIAQLKSRRQAANQVVSAIYQQSHEVPEDMLKKNPFMAQIANMDAQQVLQNLQFTFGRELEKDVVFGDLLRREAKRLKISVNDDAVTDFIKMIGTYQGRFLQGRKLTNVDFRQIRERLHLSDHAIYELLREELEARLAAEMTIPRNPVTPLQRWEDFRKVNAKQEIEVATIPVEPFVKGVSEPKDDELTAFFKDHAEKFPGFKGEPGFRQPLRVKLAYLEADYETIEATVKPPTDDEVAKYYEENKEFYRAPAVKKEEKKDDEESKEGDDSKKDDAKKEDAKKDEDAKPEPSDKPDANKPSPEKPKADSTEKAPDGDKPAEPAKPEAKKDEKSQEEKPKDKEPVKSDPQGAAGDDKVSLDKSADDAKPVEEKKPVGEVKKEEPKGEDAPKKDEPKDKPAKKDESVKEGEKKGKDKPLAEDSKTDKPAAGSDKPESDENADDKEKSETKPEVRYKSLEEVKGSIHDQLLRQRTLEKMQGQIERAVSEMRDLGSRTIADKEDKSYLSPEVVASKLKDFGKTLSLKYVETSMLSASELRASEDFKIGLATDPQDESAGRQQQVAAVIDHVFGQRGDSTHSPEIAEDAGTKNRFAYWITERNESHVPKFDEPGVRDQVVKAWKLKQAAPEAEKRAKALAKQAVDQQKLLTEVLAGQTVDGSKDGLQLTVIAPSEFSHFTRQGASAPQLNPLDTGSQPVELTQIAGLEKIDEDFMKGVDRMQLGGTDVIPNADRTGFFVVHLKARMDVAADDEAPQAKEFMEKWPFSVAADQLASVATMPLRRDWSESLERKYNVVWPVK